MEGFAATCRQCDEQFEMSCRAPHEVLLWGVSEESMFFALQCPRCSNVSQLELEFSSEQHAAFRSLSIRGDGSVVRVAEHLTGQCWCGQVHGQQQLEQPAKQYTAPRLTRADLMVHKGGRGDDAG